MTKVNYIFLFLLAIPFLSFSQQIEKSVTISIDTVELTQSEWPLFNQASEKDGNTYFQDISSLNSSVSTSVELQDEVWETLPRTLNKTELDESERLIHMVEEAGRNYSIIRTFIHPFRKNSGTWEYLRSFKLIIYYDELPSNPVDEIIPSLLSDGDIFRFKVEKEGFYKIDKNYVTSLEGISDDMLNPNNFKILGYPGGNLKEANSSLEYSNLPEVPLHFVGNNNNTWESGEYFILYAYSEDRLEYKASTDEYNYNKNLYDQQNYYYLKISDGAREELEESDISTSADYSSSNYDVVYHHENDDHNLLYESSSHYGSGKQWFGETMVNSNFLNIFGLDISNRTAGSPIHFNMSMAARSSSSTKYELLIDGESVASQFIGSVNTSSNTSTYANAGKIRHDLLPNSDRINVGIKYTASSGTSWLDYLTLDYRAPLDYIRNIEGGFKFSDQNSKNASITSFDLKRIPDNNIIMRVSSNKHYLLLSQSNGGDLTIKDNNDGVTHFYAVADLDAIKSPESAEVVENMDLLSDVDLDVLIVYHGKFTEEVERLADHRRNFNNLKVKTVNIDDIYTEFSGGRKDPTALRNYVKYLYNVSSNFNYLLLFGGGTFDYRNVYNHTEKISYVPTYETNYSLSPISAFPTDDYFGLISENEGGDISKGSIDLGVGRIPVNTEDQASNIVDKLIAYDSAPEAFADWRTTSTFMADDEDNNLHFRQADDVARYTARNYKHLNTDKIYFDAYEQVSTSGGPRFPDAKNALSNQLAQGRLTFCYLGHGSYRGLSQERVLVSDDIKNWNNKNRYPLFITATCSFSAYDDPSFYSAGELTFLKKDGGSIGLFTTTRLVYSSGNKDLTDDIFANVFKRDNAGNPLKLGDVFRLAKNENIGSNTRKFSMLGDPSMQLAIPDLQVETTDINGISISRGIVDTISALETVSLKGVIKSYNDDIITDFNGEITITVFDKSETFYTLGSDTKSYVKDFELRNTTLFKGRTSVVNGHWSIEFTLPQDINYAYGLGKISYYAYDGDRTDAWGSLNDLYLGGINQDANEDTEGPMIQVFMNDNNFQSGGITDQNPKLYVELRDDQGINISSSGLGHTPFAILDDDERFELQDFYRSNLNDPKAGTILFPLSNISSGLHRIEVKAWDLSNNSSFGYTEFLVVDDGEKLIQELLNYPNPFGDETTFSFQHTLGDFEAEISIEIYSTHGQLVRTITVDNLPLTSYSVDNITWTGNDDNGNDLANGLYFYKVKVGSNEESGQFFESNTEKLLLIK